LFSVPNAPAEKPNSAMEQISKHRVHFFIPSLSFVKVRGLEPFSSWGLNIPE
jgi:hypothetical protein